MPEVTYNCFRHLPTPRKVTIAQPKVQSFVSGFTEPSLQPTHNMKNSQLLLDVYTDLGSPRLAEQLISPVGSEAEVWAGDQHEGEQKQSQQKQEVKPICPVPIGKRVYCDPGISLEGGQSWLGEAFALVTMMAYLGWIHILLMLMVGALFNKTCLWICIGKHATLFVA